MKFLKKFNTKPLGIKFISVIFITFGLLMFFPSVKFLYYMIINYKLGIEYGIFPYLMYSIYQIIRIIISGLLIYGSICFWRKKKIGWWILACGPIYLLFIEIAQIIAKSNDITSTENFSHSFVLSSIFTRKQLSKLFRAYFSNIGKNS